MKRVRAQALALVNWKGVFYERYLLDDHVTALEGANGAGKTTVMIATYVVLLPDMTRLRFTNLGESGAIGGDRGLYGRLGEPGRPSYAVLDLVQADGQRILAGVHLERRSEPTVELTPFVVSGLAAEASLQEILLQRGTADEVPELPGLRLLAAQAGGQLTTFASAKDYFAALFDKGVTPLRLAVDEERKKYNDMLKTSMVGGISAALTGGLRDFLLKEESGLADTLRRMRQNLEACRRTRLNVAEARRLESEIHGVYQAGQEMFATALHATRARLRETEKSLNESRQRLAQQEERRDRLAAELAQSETALLEARQARESATELAHERREGRDRTRAAYDIHERLRAHAAEVAELEPREHSARQAFQAAARQHDEAMRRVQVAEADYTSAARGLADFQDGYAELQRRAAAHRQAMEARDRVRRGLDTESERYEELLAGARGQMRDLLDQAVRLERQEATAEVQRSEFARVAQALECLAGGAVPPVRAWARGLEVLAELRGLQDLADEVPLLPRRLEAARGEARAQAEARKAAAALQVGTSAEVASALDQARTRTARLEDEQRRQESLAQQAERDIQQAESRRTELEALQKRWRSVQAQASALSACWDRPLSDLGDLQVLLEDLGRRRDQALNRGEELACRLRQLHEDIGQLEGSGGHFSKELLRARDLVEGDLLASRFEDLEIEHAARQQALLGPLAEALQVEDAASAAHSLAGAQGIPDTVWLVDSSSILPYEEEGPALGPDLPGCVLVPGSGAWRLTREPRAPVLGRRARERRIAALRQEEKATDKSLCDANALLRALEVGAREARSLLPQAELLERRDPTGELLAALELRQQAEQTRQEALARGRDLLTACQDSRQRCRALESLLPRAGLLDRPDLSGEVHALEDRLEQARLAERRLGACAADRQTLSTGLEVMRTVPPTAQDLERFRAERTDCEAERDRLAVVERDLSLLLENLPALAWTDAEPALRQQQALVPGLQEQMRRAEEALGEARHREGQAREARTAAQAHRDELHNRLQVQEALLRQETERLEATGVEDPSAQALAAAEEALRQAEQASRDCAEGERRQADLAARLQERLEAWQAEVDRAGQQVAADENAWRPSRERWEQLEQLADQNGILTAATSASYAEILGSQASVSLWPKARELRAALVERLGTARDGQEMQARVRDQEGDDPEQQQGERYLHAWLAVRDWLRRRVPPQIAEVDEPLEALTRLSEHLAGLQERLDRQEQDLRGQSSDVARNIQTQVRKARRHVTLLNHDLSRVRFGSIRSVRLRTEEVRKMWDLLEKLQGNEAQQLLFENDLPIEEALDQLFQRHGGGRTGGHKLLDYREYLDLRVEVQRQGGTAWEQANPTRMSTGEAIGVGAAVMMVVLTAWERDANLFRRSRSSGTLRLLFLDEANRLSRDNLAILFDLCKNLQLQLIIAAPEVAQAEGNTTYHLVRRLDAQGREEVLVTGRRTVSDRPTEEPDEDLLAEEEVLC